MGKEREEKDSLRANDLLTEFSNEITGQYKSRYNKIIGELKNNSVKTADAYYQYILDEDASVNPIFEFVVLLKLYNFKALTYYYHNGFDFKKSIKFLEKKKFTDTEFKELPPYEKAYIFIGPQGIMPIYQLDILRDEHSGEDMSDSENEDTSEIKTEVSNYASNNYEYIESNRSNYYEKERNKSVNMGRISGIKLANNKQALNNSMNNGLLMNNSFESQLNQRNLATLASSLHPLVPPGFEADQKFSQFMLEGSENYFVPNNSNFTNPYYQSYNMGQQAYLPQSSNFKAQKLNIDSKKVFIPKNRLNQS